MLLKIVFFSKLIKCSNYFLYFRTVIAPLLRVREPKGSLYSNFWGGVDKNVRYLFHLTFFSLFFCLIVEDSWALRLN